MTKRVSLVVFLLVFLGAASAYSVTPKPDANLRVSSTATEHEEPVDLDGPISPTPEPPDVSDIDEDPAGHTDKMIEAVHAKEWGLFAGLALMFAVWLITLFWTSFPAGAIPLLSAGLGIVATVAIDMVQGYPWWRAILAGVTTGVSATGFWELLGKRVFGSVSEKRKAREEK